MVATNVLSTIYSLAVAVKGAYDGVQGNREQCKLLNDQVQNVATALRGLSAATLDEKAVKEAICSLTETLRAAADLIEGFKKKHWIKKVLWHSSVTQKFEGLFGKLDCVLTVCGFALNVTQADRSAAARKDAERMTQLVKGNASALAEVKDQSDEMLSLLKVLAAAAPAASSVDAAAVVQQWAIDAKSVQFEKEEDDDGDMVKVKLGSGSFGVVYLGTHNHTKVAVKQMDIESSAVLANFEKEVGLMFRLHHPHIVSCHGGTILKKAVRMVTELMVTSLGKEIHDNPTPFTEQQRRDVIVHIARGLSYLHAVGVTHRDLKPDNVMQDEYGTWKLIDFGMASTKGSSKKSTQKTGSNQGTQGFMAPELYTEEGGTHKVDIFAFAVTIWELYTLVRAFVGVGDLAIGDMVKAGKRPPVASVAQADVRELIAASWQQDPARRPKMADVVAIIESSGSARSSFTTPSMDITAPSAPPAPSAQADDNIKQSSAPGPQQQASEAPPVYTPLPSRNVYLAGNRDTAGDAAKLQQEKADLERGKAALEAEKRQLQYQGEQAVLAAEQWKVQLECERLAAEEKRQQQVNAVLAAEQRKVLLERDRLVASRKAGAEEIKVQESDRTPLLMQYSLQQQIQHQQMQLQQQQWQIQNQTRQPQPQRHQQQRHDDRRVVQPVAQERWCTCCDDQKGHSYCCGLCKTKPQTTCQKIFGYLFFIAIIVIVIIMTKSSSNSGSSTTLATTLAK